MRDASCIDRGAMGASVAAGCAVARSAADAVKAVDAVITMLPASGQVRVVYGEAILLNAGVSVPPGVRAEGIYALFDRLGRGGKNFSAIIELFRGRAPETI